MAKQKEAWDKLSMLEKALLIKLSVDNGVSSLKLIRDTYNLYANGGSKETSPIKDTSTKEYVVKKWPALGNIDFEVWKDPTFTREKTGAGSIEYFNAKYPGVNYLNGQYVANPSPGKDVIMYDPNTNDEQDVRLDALHIMPKDATYDALNALYRQAALNSDVSYNAKKNYERDKKLYGESNTDSYELYFNNEADGLLRNMFIEGTPLYIESKRYYPNIQQLREWNTHLLPYIDEIHKYMETGLRPSYILPEITVTPNEVLYKNGGNLTHKKSGKELGESSWLNNGYKSSNDWLLLMKMNTNQMLQNLLNSPFYMTNLEMLNLEFARMQEAIGSNSSSEAITYTGFDNNGNEITKRLPVAKGLNTMMDAGVVDYMPMLGDAKLAAEAVAAATQGDYLTAGLLGGMMFIPNIIEKPLKSLKTYIKNATNRALESALRIGDEFSLYPVATFARLMLGNKGSGLKYVFTGLPQLAYLMPYRYSGQVLLSSDNTIAESAHIGDLIDVIIGKSNTLLDEYGNTLGRLTDDISNVPDKTISAFQSLPGKSGVLPKVLKFDLSAISPGFLPIQDIQKIIDMPLNIPTEIGRRTATSIPILQGGRTVSIVDPGHYGLTALKTEDGLQLFGHDVYHYTPTSIKKSNHKSVIIPNIPITVGNPFVVEWQVPELIYGGRDIPLNPQLLPYFNVKPSSGKQLFLVKQIPNNFVTYPTSKFSTGGPLYPFSFEKNPFLKTPAVRYDEGGQTYTVKKGDTFSLIAQNVGVSIEDLQKLNPTITNVNRIREGLSINIPPYIFSEIFNTPQVTGLIHPQTVKANPIQSVPVKLEVVIPTQKGLKTAGPLDLLELAVRQAYTESRLRPDIVNSKGAYGLFQIMLPALDDYNRINKTNYTLEDMKNANNNIKVRNWYMDYLSDLGFIDKGDIQSDSVEMYKVLASFNAGAGHVRDALTKAKADGKDIYDSWDWVSYLWDEPREYADFILRGIETKGTNKNDSVYKAVSKAKSSVAEKIKDSIK